MESPAAQTPCTARGGGEDLGGGGRGVPRKEGRVAAAGKTGAALLEDGRDPVPNVAGSSGVDPKGFLGGLSRYWPFGGGVEAG